MDMLNAARMAPHKSFVIGSHLASLSKIDSLTLQETLMLYCS